MRMKWDIEEMVALVALFFLYKSNKIDDLDYELIKLSNTLRKRAEVLNFTFDEKFRNINGMRMMFNNLIYIDSKGKSGLSQAGSLSYYVYYMYLADRKRFKEILDEFDRKYR